MYSLIEAPKGNDGFLLLKSSAQAPAGAPPGLLQSDFPLVPPASPCKFRKAKLLKQHIQK